MQNTRNQEFKLFAILVRWKKKILILTKKLKSKKEIRIQEENADDALREALAALAEI